MRVDGQRDRWPRTAAGVPYPPAPWYLGGEFHLSAFRLPWTRLPDDLSGVVPTDHTVVRIGGRVTVGVAFVHYTDGGALAYEELLVALLVRKGARIRYSIPQIWVSSEESMHGGRELWGIPKQLGTFGRGTAGRSTRTTMTVDSAVVASLDASPRGPMLPGTRKLWLPTAQVLEGRRTVARSQPGPDRGGHDHRRELPGRECDPAHAAAVHRPGHGDDRQHRQRGGQQPLAGLAVYSGTKAAVVGFSTALRRELRGTDVHVASVLPYLAVTALGAGIPAQRGFTVVTPEQVAEQVVRAIRRGTAVVYVPRGLGPSIALLNALPLRVQDWVDDLIGTDRIGLGGDPATRAAYDDSVFGEKPQTL
ncbi:MAG: SDR family NAD(P)-dependent oxidoreductase [Propionibacteriaceae bacterium]